jgi:diguanylate cyclase (GGDEF)-like protein
MKKLTTIFFVLFVCITMFDGFAAANTDHAAAAGKRFLLQGEWEFYWNMLLTPEDFQNGRKPHVERINVPSDWQTAAGGKRFTEYGFATYRSTFTIPSDHIGKSKALYLEKVGSAYQLWIDGERIETIGQVGKTRNEEKPMIHPQLVFFEPENETIEVIIQVSNFSFREGGIVGEVYYGDPDAFIPSLARKQFKDIFMIGGFFFIGLYHLIIYGMRKQEISSLLLGLGGLVGAIRTAIVSNQLVYLHISVINWDVLTKIEYLVEILGFFLIMMFMKTMYPKEIHPNLLRISYAVALCISCYILFTPTFIFTNTLLLQVIIIAIVLAYFVGYVGIMAAIRKREGAYVNLVGLLIILVAILNDTLYYTNEFHTIEIFEYSILLFILLQAVIVSYRYSLLFGKNKSLTEELVTINNTLEEKVAVRTKELHERNEELFQMAHFDSLTGLYNRRYFIQQVKGCLENSNSSLAFLLMDIDNFKSINDRYGHLAGDYVLMEFSSVLKDTIGETGLAGRVGGEEFAVCFMGLTKEESLDLANQLRLLIQRHQMFLPDGTELSVTFSCGVAYSETKGSEFEELYHAADQALYISKETGKNKVTVSA